MKRFKMLLISRLKGLSGAGLRFPMSVIGLLAAAAIVFRIIAIDISPPLILQKLIFTFIVGAVLGMTAQFAVERFDRLAQSRVFVYLAALVLMVGYYLILMPAPEVSLEITVRSFVAVFALVCIVLWIPSYKATSDFNSVALIHFKSIFTSILYSGVLSGGLAAIIAAIDILLFNVNQDAYAYTMTLIWIVFAPVYYLSLLPKFNSKVEEDVLFSENSGRYPKFLEILVSYIAIPLITAYTLVLIAYFFKILTTLNWPSGQLGPMVLAYSIAGLLVFVLSSLLDNRFAVLYRLVFPKVLIPVVIMQLISVGIRLNAYGVTESRYYVALFGLFSIVAGIFLSFNPISKNGRIALLAAAFAMVSIIPPVDAFTLSRVSQINRVEAILQSEGMLINGELASKTEASEETKIETTSILFYLERSSSLKYINWLPENFAVYQDMEKTFGYEPTYKAYLNGNGKYFSVSMDGQKPLGVTGYDVLFNVFSGRYEKDKQLSDIGFSINDIDYRLKTNRISSQEVRVSIVNAEGMELIGTGLYDFALNLTDAETGTKGALPSNEMTLEVEKGDYKLRVIFQNVNFNFGSEPEAGVDYGLFVLFGMNSSK